MDQVTDILRAIRNLDQRLRTMERSSLGGGAGFELPDPLDADTVEGNSVSDILQTVYPVGSIYISVVSTNPNTLFGFGTWSSFGAGKFLVGLNSGDSSFDTVEETGGSKTHSHPLSSAGAAMIGSPSGDAGRLGFKNSQAGDLTGNKYNVPSSSSFQSGSSNPNRSHNTSLTGNTDSQTALPPYIVVYMWKRTA